MNQRVVRKAIVGAFVSLTMVSLWAVAYAELQPTTGTATVVLCTYSQVGKYDYLAWLKPNSIYETNVLGPGEGTLYSAIVDLIDLNFTYSFSSDPSWTNATTAQLVTLSLQSPGKWTKLLTPSDVKYILQMSDPFGTSHINVTRVVALAGQIDLETGVRSSEVDLNIVPLIRTLAQTPAGQIDESFSPSLKVSFITDSTAGNRIEMGNLTLTKAGAITATKAISYPDAVNKRYLSYGAAVSSAIGLVASLGVYFRERPKVREEPVEKTASQIKDLTAKIDEEPFYDKGCVMVKMTSLEDLVRVASQLGTPVLSGTRPSSTDKRPVKYFYTLDGLVKYAYVTEEQEPQAHTGIG